MTQGKDAKLKNVDGVNGNHVQLISGRDLDNEKLDNNKGTNFR
jgi:hypothetical protein